MVENRRARWLILIGWFVGIAFAYALSSLWYQPWIGLVIAIVISLLFYWLIGWERKPEVETLSQLLEDR